MNAASPDPPAVLHRDYEGDLVTLRAARRAVIDWLAGLGADDDTKNVPRSSSASCLRMPIQAAPGRTYSLQCPTGRWICDDLGTQPPNRQSAASARIVASRSRRRNCETCFRGDVGWPSLTRCRRTSQWNITATKSS